MMPLIVKDFRWTQTEDAVSLQINIPHISGQKADILTSPNYIRIHSHPHIFEAFLCHDVEEERASITIDTRSSHVLIRLPKATSGTEWVSLEKSDLDRSEKKAIREAAVDHSHKKHERIAQLKSSERQELKQGSIREQMRLEEQERKSIEAKKRAEADEALRHVEEAVLIAGETQSRVLLGTSSGEAAVSNFDRVGVVDRLAQHAKPSYGSLRGREEEVSLIQLIQQGPSGSGMLEGGGDGDSSFHSTAIWTTSASGGDTGIDGSSGGVGVPDIRKTVTIPVSFTPREFPTPARESIAVEEEEWLKKQADARRKSGFVDADLRPEERDPLWLLEKGKSLMERGSHLGAVSAFSLAIRLSPNMAAPHVQRAQAHFVLRNLMKVVEDASRALELLTPKVTANLEERFQCHLVRGRAFDRLGMEKEASLDLKEAVLLRPEDLGVYDEYVEIQTKLDHLSEDGGAGDDRHDL